ncbi:MAG: AAA family ATPase [Chloroflexi bacterium]|nr:AAA family ATPase [Chloroflexota bacterium]
MDTTTIIIVALLVIYFIYESSKSNEKKYYKPRSKKTYTPPKKTIEKPQPTYKSEIDFSPTLEYLREKKEEDERAAEIRNKYKCTVEPAKNEIIKQKLQRESTEILEPREEIFRKKHELVKEKLGDSAVIDLKSLEVPPDKEPSDTPREIPYRANFADFEPPEPQRQTLYGVAAKEQAKQRRKELYLDDIAGVEITDEFKGILARMENTNESFLITGSAGTGKSTLLRLFLAHSDKQVVVVAPTGVAALNVKGMTIHKFFRFPPRILIDEDVEERSDNAVYKELETIIIDEISMVRADLVDGIDKLLRNNGKNPDLPFGGVQMIYIGDILQLPPVVSTTEEAAYFSEVYKSPWFFDAHVFQNMPLKVVELKHIFRQKDKSFIEMLEMFRIQSYTKQQLDTINNRYMADISNIEGYYPITLTPTNKAAGSINSRKLNEINEPTYEFEGLIEGDFPDKQLPTDYILKLKKGAQVMFVKNDPSSRWVNGTIGKISDICNEYIEVEIKSKEESTLHKIKAETWKKYKYIYHRDLRALEQIEIGAFTQYPIRLAWAITIHKSQGMTFDAVKLNIGTGGAFLPGQTYVALSRCRSLEGISLQRRLSAGDITADYRAIEFYKNATYV